MIARLTNIDFSEVLTFLGYTDIPSPEILEIISTQWNKLLKIATPKLIYKVFETDKVDFLIGEDIKKLLANSKKSVVFAATLGISVDKELARLQISNMGDALIFDALASCAVENVCDNFCADIEAELGYTTRRFSPGYGDFPIEIQKELSILLDMQKAVGITLTESHLMLPQKSVTAVFGITDTAESKEKSCEKCNMFATCSLRKENKYCE